MPRVGLANPKSLRFFGFRGSLKIQDCRHFQGIHEIPCFHLIIKLKIVTPIRNSRQPPAQLSKPNVIIFLNQKSSKDSFFYTYILEIISFIFKRLFVNYEIMYMHKLTFVSSSFQTILSTGFS